MAPLPAPAEKPSHRVSDSQSLAKLRPPAQVAVFCAAPWPNLQPALTDTTGQARNLLVHALEEWPEDRVVPASLATILPPEPEGRIAIWGVLTERLLDLEIKEILGSLLRVK